MPAQCLEALCAMKLKVILVAVRLLAAGTGLQQFGYASYCRVQFDVKPTG